MASKRPSDLSRVPEWYTFEIYPEDFGNLFDLASLSILCSRNCDDWAFIVHKAESDDKKEHVHVLCHSLDYQHTDGWLKKMPSESAFRHWIPVKRPCEMARYFLHQTDKAIKAGKMQYSRDSVTCSSDDWFDSLLSGDDSANAEREQNEEVQNALSILDDSLALSCRKISMREFLSRHPEAVYRMASIKTLIEFDNRSVSEDVYRDLMSQHLAYVNELEALRVGISKTAGEETYYAFLAEGKKLCESD